MIFDLIEHHNIRTLKTQFAYDLWGDTINVASRMESASLPGRIQLSRSSYERVYDIVGFSFEERLINVKGKGECVAYLLDEKHHINPIIYLAPSLTDILCNSSVEKQSSESSIEVYKTIVEEKSFKQDPVIMSKEILPAGTEEVVQNSINNNSETLLQQEGLNC